MNDFVPKPVEPLDLFDALLRWLPERPEASRADTPRSVASPGTSGEPSSVRRADRLAAIRLLPGIDLRQGLSSLRGSQEKYLSLIERFVGSHADDPKRLAEALANRDGEALARLAHGLKGVSGTLGLVAVAERARALEVARRPGGLDDPAGLIEAIEDIDQALLSLRNAIEQSRPPERPDRPLDVTLDPEQARALLDELAVLLREDNALALTVYQRESVRLAAFMPGEHVEFGNLIARFDFESALELIDMVRARLDRTERPAPP